MQVIYEFENDLEGIKNLQNGMLSSNKEIGLKNTHGLIGTSEWFLAIEHGTLEKKLMRGIVRGLWLDQHETGPAHFLIELESGKTFKSLCHVSVAEAKLIFKLGQFCEIEYVLQERKKEFLNFGKFSEIVIKISLGTVIKNEVEPISPCYFTYAGKNT